MKTCYQCKVEKPLSGFKKEKRSQDGVQNMCRDCVNENRRNNPKTKELRNTPMGRAHALYFSLKKGAVQRDIPFDITAQWIADRIMEGRCQATGIPFVLRSADHDDTVVVKGQMRNPWSPSVDRKDTHKGYTEDNCVVVCFMYNMCKGCFSEDAVEMFCRGYLSND